MHARRARVDALLRMIQNWSRDRKFIRSCWCLHWFLGLRADVWKNLFQVRTRLEVSQEWIEKLHFSPIFHFEFHSVLWGNKDHWAITILSYFLSIWPILAVFIRMTDSDWDHSLSPQLLWSCLPLGMRTLKVCPPSTPLFYFRLTFLTFVWRLLTDWLSADSDNSSLSRCLSASRLPYTVFCC